MVRSAFVLLIVLTGLFLGSAAAAQVAPPWLGVILAEGKSDGAGVDLVIRNSPADKAGIEAGDRIIEINGEAVNSPGKLQMIVRGQRPGATMRVRVDRQSVTREVAVVLAPSPSVDAMLAGHHIGHEPPAFTFSPIGADTASVASTSLKGKPLIVEFWATWCTPCRPVARDLGNIARRFDGQVHIVGISSEERSILERYVANNTPNYTVAQDIDEQAHQRFLARSYPVAFLLDADHRVVGVFTGTDLGPRLEKALAALLREAAGQEKQNGAPKDSDSLEPSPAKPQ